MVEIILLGLLKLEDVFFVYRKKQFLLLDYSIK